MIQNNNHDNGRQSAISFVNDYHQFLTSDSNDYLRFYTEFSSINHSTIDGTRNGLNNIIDYLSGHHLLIGVCLVDVKIQVLDSLQRSLIIQVSGVIKMKDADRSSKRRFHETLLLARRSRSVQFYVRNDIITIDDNDLPMLHNGHDCSNHGDAINDNDYYNCCPRDQSSHQDNGIEKEILRDAEENQKREIKMKEIMESVKMSVEDAEEKLLSLTTSSSAVDKECKDQKADKQVGGMMSKDGHRQLLTGRQSKDQSNGTLNRRSKLSQHQSNTDQSWLSRVRDQKKRPTDAGNRGDAKSYSNTSRKSASIFEWKYLFNKMAAKQDARKKKKVRLTRSSSPTGHQNIDWTNNDDRHVITDANTRILNAIKDGDDDKSSRQKVLKHLLLKDKGPKYQEEELLSTTSWLPFNSKDDFDALVVNTKNGRKKSVSNDSSYYKVPTNLHLLSVPGIGNDVENQIENCINNNINNHNQNSGNQKSQKRLKKRIRKRRSPSISPLASTKEEQFPFPLPSTAYQKNISHVTSSTPSLSASSSPPLPPPRPTTLLKRREFYGNTGSGSLQGVLPRNAGKMESKYTESSGSEEGVIRSIRHVQGAEGIYGNETGSDERKSNLQPQIEKRTMKKKIKDYTDDNRDANDNLIVEKGICNKVSKDRRSEVISKIKDGEDQQKKTPTKRSNFDDANKSNHQIVGNKIKQQEKDGDANEKEDQKSEDEGVAIESSDDERYDCVPSPILVGGKNIVDAGDNMDANKNVDTKLASENEYEILPNGAGGCPKVVISENDSIGDAKDLSDDIEEDIVYFV